MMLLSLMYNISGDAMVRSRVHNFQCFDDYTLVTKWKSM